ncbi:MAG: DUF3108 domain-containing protein [Geobacteraceae bacterium]|nr:DUF3108 domain-containing protein [Geobacteraceae bacterium]
MSINGFCLYRSAVKNMFLMLFVFTWLSTILACTNASALTIPEKLVYDLTWTGIKAGTATQEIVAENGEIKITSIARSVDWITVFFPVEDRIVSILSANPEAKLGQSKSYSLKTREGSHRRDREVQFNHAKGIAYYKDNLNGEKRELPIASSILDTLSSFYFVRTLKLEVGKSVFLTILDNLKTWNVEVQVLRKEKIKTSLGTFDTIVIKPLMQSEGIIDRKGEMLIWLTDDKRLLPVKMKTKVKIGSVTATLVGGSFQH